MRFLMWGKNNTGMVGWATGGAYASAFFYNTPAGKRSRFKVYPRVAGHESSKTNEIYTHLTHTGWAKVKSPIEDLDI